MRKPRRSFHLWLGACALAATVHCGGPAQQTQQGTTAAVPPRTAAHPAAMDLSEVAAPAELLALVRVASPTQLVARIGQLTGLGPRLESGLESVFREVTGERSVGAVLDRGSTVDLAWLGQPDDVAFVLSFGAPAVEQVESRLANTHRLSPMGNGVQRIERIQERRPGANEDEFDRYEPRRRMQCALAPTPRPHESRVVCSQNAAALEAIVPYLARTLPRREVPAHAVTVEVVAEPIRRLYSQLAQAGLDEARQGFAAQFARNATGPWRDPGVQQRVVALFGELLDNARALLNEGVGYNATLTFAEDRVVWHNALDVRGPTGTLLRALAESLRAQQAEVPQEHLARLLPDGLVYGAGTFDVRPFRAQITQLVELASALLEQERGLTAADRAAFRQALDAVIVMDQAAFTVASGYDEHGEAWGAGTYRLASRPPAEVVAAYRTVVRTLRRPNVARVLRALGASLNINLFDMREVRDLPTQGLPAGAYGFSTPSLAEAFISRPAAQPTAQGGAARPARGRRGATPAAARRPATQWLLVPSGQDLYFVVGPDARALYARHQANTAPGIEPQLLRAPGAALVTALVPAGFPNLLRATAPSEATQVAGFLARMQDQGRTPILMRLGATETEGVTHFTGDLEVRAATLSIFQAFAPLLGP